MSPGLLIFSAIAIGIILGGGVAVFFLLRRRGTLLAVASGVFTAAALVLVWPIPIHGGFMLLAEAIYDEWSRDLQLRKEVRSDREQQMYLQSYAMRFAGELPILHRDTLAAGWQRVTYAPGRSAWLDTTNAQIWSDWLPLPETPSLPPLELAKNRCAKYPPAGYWSLPTEAEHALMWKADGFKVLPAAVGGSVSVVVDVDYRMEIPSYDVGASSNTVPRAREHFAVHCVARGPDGPQRGFFKRDVPLEDWNHYQLSKAG